MSILSFQKIALFILVISFSTTLNAQSFTRTPQSDSFKELLLVKGKKTIQIPEGELVKVFAKNVSYPFKDRLEINSDSTVLMEGFQIQLSNIDKIIKPRMMLKQLSYFFPSLSFFSSKRIDMKKGWEIKIE